MIYDNLQNIKTSRLFVFLQIEADPDMDCSQSPIGRHLGLKQNWGEYKMPVGSAQFVRSPVSLASRDQDGRPSTSTIDIYDLTEK